MKRRNSKLSENFQDSRSTQGRFARGNNVYGGGTNNSVGGQGNYSPNTRNADMGPGRQNNYQMASFGGLGGGTPSESSQPYSQPDITGAIDFGSVVESALEDMSDYQPNFDQNYENTMRSLNRRKSNLQAKERQAKATTKQKFNRQAEDLEEQQQEAQEDLTNKLTNQGILRSGIYTGERGDLSEDYTQAKGRLEENRANTLTELENRFAGKYNEIQTGKETAEQKRAERERQRERRLARQRARAAARRAAAERAKQRAEARRQREQERAQARQEHREQMREELRRQRQQQVMEGMEGTNEPPHVEPQPSQPSKENENTTFPGSADHAQQKEKVKTTNPPGSIGTEIPNTSPDMQIPPGGRVNAANRRQKQKDKNKRQRRTLI
jgi:hypothetical protein